MVDFCFNTSVEANEVILTFVTDLKANEVVVRKYNTNTQQYDNVVVANITETTYEDQSALRVTYTIVDNGPLDLDADAGEISDPVGLGRTIDSPATGQKNITEWFLSLKK